MGKHTKGDKSTDNTAVFGVIPDNMGKGLVWNEAEGKYDVSLTDYVDGTTITVSPDGKLSSTATGSGGLDCDAISALPLASWKKGTSILAKQDGKCVRLVPNENFFQEVGVGIAANKTSAFTNEEYEVTVTVSNTGVSKNELTDWVIVKPADGGYTIKNIRVSSEKVDRVETVSEFNYKLHGLASGGTAIVRFTVVPTEVGTYQFSSAVTPHSALDQNVSNNSDTITLSATTRSNPNYVPSVDCPLVTATELDSNVVLTQVEYTQYSNDLNAIATKRSNVFANRRSLKGLRIRLVNASTVIGYSKIGGFYSYGIILSNGTFCNSYSIKCDADGVIADAANAKKTGTGGFTFSGGVLEITEDITSFAFSCRPQGNNCKWQSYTVFATIPTKKLVITTSNIVGGTTKLEKLIKKGGSDTFPTVNVIPSSIKASFRVSDSTSLNPAEVVDKLVFTVKSGTAASLNYTSTENYASQVFSQGKTTITANSITVSADAKPTDSVNSEYIQVIVE